MNIKELIFPMLLALGTTLLIQRWFAPAPEGAQRMTAPKSEQVQRPLNRAVVLVPTSAAPQIEKVDTAYGTLEFSTHGASLNRAFYDKTVQGRPIALEPISPSKNPENLFFLVALEQTPLDYTLVERKNETDTVRLHYHAQTNEASIDKIYTVHTNSFVIDCALTINPTKPVYPRLLFTSPYIPSTKSDAVAGVAQELQSVSKYSLARDRHALNDDVWIAPRIFGAEDRYFLHALVRDQNQFIQRGYYSIGVLDPNDTKLTVFVEGPKVEKETTWNMSFYVGPKEQKMLAAVDPQLESVLDYGWLGFIVKPMIWLFNWLVKYVHSLGWAIILFTILIRLAMLPLTLRAAKGAERAREMQRKLQYLKQKYKDDPELFAQEQAELFKKHGMESLTGLGGGCLPILLQMPVFFALNRMLASSIEMCCAPFLWISDLSAPDPIILPLLVAASSYLATYQAANDNQQRITGLVIAVMFGAFAMSFPAGLSLYIVVSTLTGAGQMILQKSIA